MLKKISILVLCTSLGACVVSKKKFDALNVEKSGLEVEKADCNEALKSEQNKNKDLTAENEAQKKKIQELSDAKLKTEADLKQLKEQYQILSQVSNTDAQKLKQEIEKTQNLQETLEQKTATLDAKTKELDAKNQALRLAQKDLEKDRKSIDSLNKTLAAREKRVAELEEILAQQKAAVEALRSKVAASLMAFSKDELQVEVKDGKVYVSMAEILLFKTGQYNIDTKGLQALKDLSVVLAKQTDVDIVVEGHTDNVAFTSSTLPKDNWDLSVLRATTVVRELQKNGVAPKTLVASGRSQYLPKVEGNTTTDKALNRRIEIIISPSLEELYKLLESN
jgi:chemotaxis protein MotB